MGDRSSRFTDDVDRLLYFGFDPSEVRRLAMEPADLVLLFDTQIDDDASLLRLLRRWITSTDGPAEWLVSMVQLSRLAPPSAN
jgi:hypothetical protein